VETISCVNQKIVELWGKWEKKLRNIDEHLPVPFLYSGKLRRNALLFVGLNPSFLPDLYNPIWGHIEPKTFAGWSNCIEIDKVQQAIERENVKRRKYRRYFGVFQDISKKVGAVWEHIDLFFYRKLKQDDFKRQIYENDSLTEFVLCQLRLSKELIHELQPRIIVVANKLASDIFCEEWKLKTDEERGYDLAFVSGKNTPVFLGSMLSGQRALDIYSRKRLIWHIKKAIKEIPNE